MSETPRVRMPKGHPLGFRPDTAGLRGLRPLRFLSDDPGHGMSLIVKTITRLLAVYILLYGLYVVLYGHLSPGGGFSGGVVLACGLVLVVLAFGRRFMGQFVSARAAGLWDSGGAFAFLAIGVGGYLAGRFFQNFLHTGKPFELVSGGTIPLSNIAIGIKVSASLFAVFMVLAAFRRRGAAGGGDRIGGAEGPGDTRCPVVDLTGGAEGPGEVVDHIGPATGPETR